MLNNPYTRIAIAAGIATLIAPAIQRKLMQVEMTTADGVVNQVAYYGVAGATTAFVFTLLSMTLGAPVKA